MAEQITRKARKRNEIVVHCSVFGPPLFEWLCESPSYSESQLVQYSGQLLAALSHLHQRRVIHLDLKPENLVLEADNSTLRLWSIYSLNRVFNPISRAD